MISVIIPTLNAGTHLVHTMAALVPATVDGLIKEVIVSDGGSRDETLDIADAAGAEIVTGHSGRGSQLKAGALQAQFPWLLFLHADTVLEHGWHDLAGRHIERVARGLAGDQAATFRFALADQGVAPRVVEAGVAFRSGLLGLPYGDQGLLVSRKLYDAVGGFRDMAIMEDVDLVRRIGRRRLVTLPIKATTSPRRYRQQGYLSRIARNQLCLSLYFAGIDPERIRRIYEGRPDTQHSVGSHVMRGEA
ncbi:MAG: TIGR04283 family arsenosugar biosynthesis glycosyltransferase [Hyphomicrobium sp.]|nr:TIGR04283 family arsenosugar biosynthesis glycosyltransferase [Hyphomicrobium sp.]